MSVHKLTDWIKEARHARLANEENLIRSFNLYGKEQLFKSMKHLMPCTHYDDVLEVRKEMKETNETCVAFLHGEENIRNFFSKKEVCHFRVVKEKAHKRGHWIFVSHTPFIADMTKFCFRDAQFTVKTKWSVNNVQGIHRIHFVTKRIRRCTYSNELCMRFCLKESPAFYAIEVIPVGGQQAIKYSHNVYVKHLFTSIGLVRGFLQSVSHTSPTLQIRAENARERKPKTLERDDVKGLCGKNYTVTEKTDGLCMDAVIDIAGFLILQCENAKENNTQISFPKKWTKTLFRGEFVAYTTPKQYHVFDCILPSGRKDLEHASRMRNAHEIIADMSCESDGDVVLYVKKFHVFEKDTLAETCDAIMNQEKVCDVDGLIFTPTTTMPLLKWKPPCLNTIDFRLRRVVQRNRTLQDGNFISRKMVFFSLWVGAREGRDGSRGTKRKYTLLENIYHEHHFVPITKHPEMSTCEDGYCCIPVDETGTMYCKTKTGWNGSRISDNAIVEMMFDPKETHEKRWVPLRVRDDKRAPNSYTAAYSVWNTLCEPIQLLM